MDEVALTQYLLDTFPGVEAVVASGDRYFVYHPDGGPLPAQWFPFVTLVTSDQHDQASNLSRPCVYRLNIGVEKETYRSLFGPPPVLGPAGVVETGHDFTALDQLLPHPVYAPQSWICVLNPGEATLSTVQALLAEAYDRAVRKHPKSRSAEGD